jgi:hypothetical protein
LRSPARLATALALTGAASLAAMGTAAAAPLPGLPGPNLFLTLAGAVPGVLGAPTPDSVFSTMPQHAKLQSTFDQAMHKAAQ